MDADANAARPFIEAAKPEHPSLIDAAHTLGETLGIVNVPMSAWIDEAGNLVRVGDTAAVGPSPLREIEITDAMPPRVQEAMREVKAIETDWEPFHAALRDWVEKGASSAYAHSPDEVVKRSPERPPEQALAAANFEMGQHLYRAGHADEAVSYWREAHRLQPDNWTYKRQAWSLADRNQGPTDLYEGHWLKDVQAIGGGAKYYPRFRT